MRFYTFIHWMLRPIQQGIQSEHVLQEVFNKYVDERDFSFKPGYKALFDWSRNHKTAIVLNGGVTQNLKDLFDFLNSEVRTMEIETGFTFPWASFSEDRFSMDDMMTGVGIVLPKEIYDAISSKRLSSELQSQINVEPGWYYISDVGPNISYKDGSAVAKFLDIMKSCALAS